MKNFINLLLLIVTALMIIWFMVAQPLFTSQSMQQRVVEVKAENLKKSVYELVEKFDGRVYDNLKVLNSTAEYIYDRFAQHSSKVRYQSYTLHGLLEEDSFEYKNVILKIKGQEACAEG